MKTFAAVIAFISFSVPAFASSNPCSSFATELEPQIHQELQRMQVSNLDQELMAVSWQTTETTDGKFIIIRQSYIAAKDGTITDELMATAECDSVSKSYKLLRVTDTQPVLKLRLGY